MATLYEIDKAYQDALNATIDMETGEILDESGLDKLHELKMDFDKKVSNTACFIKNTNAEIDALDNEIKALQARKKAKKNTVDYLKGNLAKSMDGKTYEDAKCKVSFRKSEQIVIADNADIPAKYLIAQEPKVNKAELKKCLKQGMEFYGVSLEEHSNIQIK